MRTRLVEIVTDGAVQQNGAAKELVNTAQQSWSLTKAFATGRVIYERVELRGEQGQSVVSTPSASECSLAFLRMEEDF